MSQNKTEAETKPSPVDYFHLGLVVIGLSLLARGGMGIGLASGIVPDFWRENCQNEALLCTWIITKHVAPEVLYSAAGIAGSIKGAMELRKRKKFKFDRIP